MSGEPGHGCEQAMVVVVALQHNCTVVPFNMLFLFVDRYAGLVSFPPGLVGQVIRHNPHIMELELSRYCSSKAHLHKHVLLGKSTSQLDALQ